MIVESASAPDRKAGDTETASKTTDSYHCGLVKRPAGGSSPCHEQRIVHGFRSPIANTAARVGSVIYLVGVTDIHRLSVMSQEGE